MDVPKPVPTAVGGERVCACGARFTCDLAAGKARCWCADHPRVMPVPGKDAACLCPDCLRKAVEAKLGGSRST